MIRQIGPPQGVTADRASKLRAHYLTCRYVLGLASFCSNNHSRHEDSDQSSACFSLRAFPNHPSCTVRASTAELIRPSRPRSYGNRQNAAGPLGIAERVIPGQPLFTISNDKAPGTNVRRVIAARTVTSATRFPPSELSVPPPRLLAVPRPFAPSPFRRVCVPVHGIGYVRTLTALYSNLVGFFQSLRRVSSCGVRVCA
jgi:hypothetical protein